MTIPTEFLAWARTMPADQRYDFAAPTRCAVSQFGKAAGRSELVDLADRELRAIGLEEAVNPGCVSLCAGLPMGWTFGELVVRLEVLAMPSARALAVPVELCSTVSPAAAASIAIAEVVS